MRLFDRYLIVVFGLVALTGIATTLLHGGSGPERPALIHDVPQRVGGWVAAEGAPDDVLPIDPRALEGVRRTYVKDHRVVWVAVARYHSQNDPRWRPSVNLIVPERGAISVGHRLLEVNLDGAATGAIPVNLLSVRWPQRRVTVVYWYQLGGDTVADDYRLRLRLLLETLRFRHRALFLVRLATAEPEPPEEFLREFYPRVTDILMH